MMWIPSFWVKFRAARAGRVDGSAGIPQTRDNDLAEYEGNIINWYKSALNGYWQKYKDADAKLAEPYCIAKRDRDNAFEAYEKKRNALQREVTIHLEPWKYWAVIALLLVVETGVNGMVFIGILRESWIGAGALAAALALLVSTFAHFSGWAIRESKARDERSGASGLEAFIRWLGFHRVPAWTVIGSLVLLVLLGVLAYMRAVFFGHPDPEDIEFLPEAMRYLDPIAVAVLFLLINVLIYVVAVILSYQSHDSDPDYHEAWKTLKKRERPFKKLHARRTGNKDHWIGKAKVTINVGRQALNIYRRNNRLQRTDKTKPEVWTEKTPELLLKIEDCDFTWLPCDKGTGAASVTAETSAKKPTEKP